jgi:YihY family inner membrane protein
MGDAMHPTTARLRLGRTPFENFAETARIVARGTVRRFLDARGFDLASSLAYSSLLTLVPLIASVTVLTSTLFGQSGVGIYRILRLALPGANREVVADLQTLVRYASLSGSATIFFLVTSLRTYFLVEGAAKALWGTTVTPRPPLRRLGTSLAVMILGPIAIGVLTSLLLESGSSLSGVRPLGSVLTFVLLVYLYRTLPGAVVRWGSALAGAFFGATTITLLRVAITRGVAQLAGGGNVYGPLTAAIIFVVAVGFVFVLFLLGISLAHAIQFRAEFLDHDALAERTEEGGHLYESVRLLLALAVAWRNDRATRTLAALAGAIGRPESYAVGIVHDLREAGLVAASEGGAFSLSRPPETISLYSVARAIGESAARAVPKGTDAVATSLHRIFGKAAREERAVLQGTSLLDLLTAGSREQNEAVKALVTP